MALVEQTLRPTGFTVYVFRSGDFRHFGIPRMRLLLRLSLATCLLLISATARSLVAGEGVPSITPDYQSDVRAWWGEHPLNPRSKNAVAEITSPHPVVDLKPGSSIDDAVSALPSAGGTLRLAAGTYGPFRIVGRSNIHILGPESGEAVITGPSYLAVCPEAMDYVKFDAAVSKFDSHPLKDRRLWELYRNPTRNFLLKNLVFDGEGKTAVDFPGVGIQGPGGALGLKRVRDVLVDRCVFRNFVDTKTGLQHCGLAWGHYGLTNVWFRNCTFSGVGKYAVYLDGAHGSGLVGCKIDGKGCVDGGLLFLANHDFTDDLNENDRLDADEEKCAKFVAIADCTFDWSRGTPIRYTGRELLVTRSKFTGLMTEVVGVYPTGEIAHRAWPAGHYAIRILDNEIGTCARAAVNFFEANPEQVERTRAVPSEAQATVAGNRVAKSPAEILYTPLRK
jgi:hypothetical protein